MPWQEQLIDSASQLAVTSQITFAELVWHVVAAILWGGLAFIAWSKLSRIPSPDEKLLGWAFGFGFAQETLILIAKSVAWLNLISPRLFQVAIPPLGLSLQNVAIILVASGYLWYLAKQESSAKAFAKIGIAVVALSYLVTFSWWGKYVSGITLIPFERTWCSGLMHGAMSLLLFIPLFIWVKQTGWLRYWASLAIFCFWLSAAISVIGIFLGVSQEHLLTFGRIFYTLGITWLGYVYLRELIDHLGRESQHQRIWKEQFEAFMDNSPFIAWVKNADGEHQYLSQPYALQIGIPDTGWVGKTDYELWPREVAKSHVEMDKVALESGRTIAFETIHRLPGGGIKEWYVVKFPFTVEENGGEQFIGGIGLDVTDKKQAELDRDRFFEYSSELMCIADEKMCFRRVNRAFEDILGFRQQELIDKSFYELVHPRDRPAVDAALRRSRSDVKFISFETRYRCHDGTYRLIAWTTPIADSESGSDLDTKTVFAVGRDITEQRALERRLLKIADEEQRRIARDLHDGLGQELTGLAMMAESLALNLKDQHQSEFELANKISAQLDASRQLTQSLARGLRPIEIDSDGIESALAQLANRTDESYRLTCSFESQGNFETIDPDWATQLYRIAQEAVSNAIRHAKPTTIQIQLIETNGVLQLKIVDDGIGIKKLDQSQPGIGIKSMQYRSNVIGGELRVEPNTPHGTIVICNMAMI